MGQANPKQCSSTAFKILFKIIIFIKIRVIILRTFIGRYFTHYLASWCTSTIPRLWNIVCGGCEWMTVWRCCWPPHTGARNRFRCWHSQATLNIQPFDPFITVYHSTTTKLYAVAVQGKVNKPHPMIVVAGESDKFFNLKSIYACYFLDLLIAGAAHVYE